MKSKWSFLSLVVLCIPLYGDTLVSYSFDSDAKDSSGFGLDGELFGDAEVKDGRLVIPGDFDNGVEVPLGEFNPFDGQTSWTLSFDFQTEDGGTGALFSSDGSSEEDSDEIPWPDHPETGSQEGSLNVFLWPEDGTVRTDFWFIDAVTSVEVYDDDEVHTYQGIFDAETGDFTQIIDGEDEVFGNFVFDRDTSLDRVLIGDESNSDFGGEFNPEGFSGSIDNLVIDSSGKLPDASLPGDFNTSGSLDLEDVNSLRDEIIAGTNQTQFDLNEDSSVDNDDLKIWVKDLRNSWIGDANLDGEFNSTDFVEVFQAGKFEKDEDAAWQQGDWNGDGRFNSTDFVAAFQDGGFEQGPRDATASVPEPNSMLLACIAASILAMRFRNACLQ